MYHQVYSSLKHIGTVYSVSFSDDGKHIISGSGDNDNTIRIWEMDNEKEIKEQNSLNGHTNNVHFVSFCNMDNRMCLISASSDKTIRIWDAESGKEIRVFRGHTNRVLFACFDKNKQCVVSASADGTVRFWDYPSLQELLKQTSERFNHNPLTKEERKKYYLD